MYTDSEIANFWVDRNIAIEDYPNHIFSDTFISNSYQQWGFEYPASITKSPSACSGKVMIGIGTPAVYWPYSILGNKLMVGELGFTIVKMSFFKPKTMVLKDASGNEIVFKGKV